MNKQKRIAYRRATRFLVLPLALMAAVAGCNKNSEGPMFTRSAGQSEDVTITVDNQNFLDADVYALWNDQRDRVGFATGKTTQTFNVDWRAPSMQMEIHLIAGGTMTTDQISVYEGDNVQLVIPPTR